MRRELTRQGRAEAGRNPAAGQRRQALRVWARSGYLVRVRAGSPQVDEHTCLRHVGQASMGRLAEERVEPATKKDMWHWEERLRSAAGFRTGEAGRKNSRLDGRRDENIEDARPRAREAGQGEERVDPCP